MADEPDPSTLTDEQLEKIIAGESLDDDSAEKQDDQDDADTQDDQSDGQHDNTDDDSHEDDKQTDKADDKQDDTQSDAADQQSADQKPSRREERRIAQLLQKYPNLREEQPQAPVKPADALDYKQSLDADEDTIKRLESDREQYGKTQYNAGLEQAKSILFHTRLEIDAPRVEAKYPQLDKNNDEKFKQDVANDINTLYLTLVGYDAKSGQVQNPELRYSDFVDTIFTISKDLASEEAREMTRSVKKQVAKTALRPDGGSAKQPRVSADPSQMSTEDLQAYLDSVIPKR